jgi:hypothetical protein
MLYFPHLWWIPGMYHESDRKSPFFRRLSTTFTVDFRTPPSCCWQEQCSRHSFLFSCSTSPIFDGFQECITRAIESPIVFFLSKVVHPHYRGDSGRPFLLAPLSANDVSKLTSYS